MIGTSESRAHVIHPTGTFGISSKDGIWSTTISFLNLLSHQRVHSSDDELGLWDCPCLPHGCRLWNLVLCLGSLPNPAQFGHRRSSESNWITRVCLCIETVDSVVLSWNLMNCNC